ncbi:hypothetical protein PF005_g17924 [Phytophthora fragariae]|uniref:WW domain-containing protein n=1 Tax=Phytophthora fragariae TaxID=53985 RepID=A0A6A3WZH4_9STRA|nr:hypothetical protein PF010_g17279 [Phytophthora fragariae]KAE9125714.1 hypothetical protein PF006_g16893 [Phytophthora fragariae]KAE9193834.1 hypothetical protein PF005_g17924 [Phytophthora fragariae]KAE9208189.1 hypothetical protein PF004_g16832 [Phytophthora fragariae]KAE9209470.1 hypothetical protein PF002_g19096 [Phytophthora fragariae]
MDRVSKRPWFRKSRNALYHCAAFIVGSTYEDERVAFTAPKLVKNDAYRDRLLVPEIEDLVTLCDALRLTLPQRKAYFQCFLHLDFMRRSSISRAELLRYCTLRATPLTSFLLPNAEEATHRDAARNRWDIMQLMAACFSICTADIVELVQFAVAEATRPPEATADESDDEGSIQGHDDNEDVVVQADKKTVDDKQATHGNPPGICQQIDQCLAFFVGVPDPMERSLKALLIALYDDEHLDDPSKRGNSTVPCIRFREIHGVTSIFDVVRLFPVLIFPCVWTQRVIRTRILGVKTWQSLQQRRIQLQPHLPVRSLFLSVADIVAASQVQLQQKVNRDDGILTPTGDQQNVGSSTPSTALLDGLSGRSDLSASSKASTPRKVVPCTDSEHAKSDAGASSYAVEEPNSLRLTFDQCSSSKEAWRVSANHALASVYIQCLQEDTSVSSEELRARFEEVTTQIFAGELSAEQSEKIRQRLVKTHGYHFAQTLLAKSNVKELNHASKTPLDERRSKQRYAKAWRGSTLVEDKMIYWKEFEDPVANRLFYYNVRTGESRWEKPPNFVGKKKARRRRKLKDQEELQKIPA